MARGNRSTCRQVAAAHSAHIAVDKEALERLAHALKPDEVVAAPRGLQLPIKFDSVEAEVREHARQLAVSAGPVV